MKQKKSAIFLIGLFVGGLVGLLFWYWQKSTSAEDGALDLLDRLAAAEKRVRQPTMALASQSTGPEKENDVTQPQRVETMPSFMNKAAEDEPDDLTQVKGIGAVYNGRLQQSGIVTLAQLKALSAEALADVLQIQVGRAENILAEANNL